MSLRKNRVLKLNILLLVLAMACLFYYDYMGGLVLKGITSAWFIGLGVLNLIYTYQTAPQKLRVTGLMVAGLAFAFAADVLLSTYFMTGIVLFAIGHLFYCAAYCALERIHLRDLIPVVAVGILSLLCLLCTPYIQVDDPTLQPLLVSYAVIISCMFGKALANLLRHPSRTRWLLLTGSVLFWFSDFMLALSIFGSGGALASRLCLYTYWPGQYLLAHTLYHYLNDSGEQTLHTAFNQ